MFPMARFLVVVIILAAVGYLGYKYLLGKGDVPPADAKATANASADKKSDAAKTEAASEKATADAAPDTQVSTDLQQPGGVKPKLDAAKTVKVTGENISKMLPTEKVALGDPSLTAGIPGEGDLTNEQIDKWLADPKNHVVLKPELPLGLQAGEGEIKGLDENPLTRAKIELGRQLYFDPRLSSDVSISC